MQLQNTPCTAQVAGHTSDKTWPAKLRATSDTILAAEPLIDSPHPKNMQFEIKMTKQYRQLMTK